MGLKNLISSILTLLLAPNKVSTKHLSCSKGSNTAAADVGASMQCHSLAAAECAVCLSTLKGGAGTGTTVLPCRHEFHGECVERWLAVPHFKNTCPICRFSMEECWSGGGGELRRLQQECFTEEMLIWFSSFHVAGF